MRARAATAQAAWVPTEDHAVDRHLHLPQHIPRAAHGRPQPLTVQVAEHRMVHVRRDRAEIAWRSRRDRVENAPSAAHSRAAVRRLLGTCDQDGRHTFERDELRDKIDAMLSKSVHSRSRPCPRHPAATPLASNRGMRPPQVCVSGPLPRRPRVPRPGAMDPRDGRDRAEPRVRSARQIAFSAAAEAHVLIGSHPPRRSRTGKQLEWSQLAACMRRAILYSL